MVTVFKQAKIINFIAILFYFSSQQQHKARKVFMLLFILFLCIFLMNPTSAKRVWWVLFTHTSYSVCAIFFHFCCCRRHKYDCFLVSFLIFLLSISLKFLRDAAHTLGQCNNIFLQFFSRFSKKTHKNCYKDCLEELFFFASHSFFSQKCQQPDKFYFSGAFRSWNYFM